MYCTASMSKHLNEIIAYNFGFIFVALAKAFTSYVETLLTYSK